MALTTATQTGSLSVLDKTVDHLERKLDRMGRRSDWEPHFMTDVLDQSLDVLMENLATVLTAAGVPADKALRAFSTALDNVAPETITKTPDFELGSDARHFYGSIVATWLRTPEYVDNLGKPLPLSRDGDAPSLLSLYTRVAERHAKVSVKTSFDDAVDRLALHNVITPVGDGRFRLVRNIFPVNQEGTTSAIDQLDYITTFVSTSAYNVIHGGADGRFQRTAGVSNFPLRQLPILTRMLNDEGMDLLTNLDSYLESESDIPSQEAGHDGHAATGVGLYLFVKDH